LTSSQFSVNLEKKYFFPEHFANLEQPVVDPNGKSVYFKKLRFLIKVIFIFLDQINDIFIIGLA